MQLVPGTGRGPAKVKALAEATQRTPSRALKCLSFAHERLKPLGQQPAHRAPLFGSEHAGFAQQVTSSFRVMFVFMILIR